MHDNQEWVTLYTGKGHPFLVDARDAEEVSQFRWCRALEGYIYRNEGRRTIYLHRWLVQATKGKQVHHKLEDPADNRRSNLVVLTPSEHRKLHLTEACGQQMRNVGDRNSPGCNLTSVYRGVYRCGEKWRVSVHLDGKCVKLGYHDTEEEAAIVFDAFVMTYRGGRGYMNLIPNQEGEELGGLFGLRHAA